MQTIVYLWSELAVIIRQRLTVRAVEGEANGPEVFRAGDAADAFQSAVAESWHAYHFPGGAVIVCGQGLAGAAVVGTPHCPDVAGGGGGHAQKE